MANQRKERACKTWCQQCKSIKEQYKNLDTKPNSVTIQNFLFSQARQKLLDFQEDRMMSNCLCNRSGSCEVCCEISGLKRREEMDHLEKRLSNIQFQIVNQEIKKLAGVYTLKWLEQIKTETTCIIDQIVWVYRILLYPEHILRSLMFQEGEKQARKNFRKMAIIVHPDKNQHPLSSASFKKLLKVFGSH